MINGLAGYYINDKQDTILLHNYMDTFGETIAVAVGKE